MNALTEAEKTEYAARAVYLKSMVIALICDSKKFLESWNEIQGPIVQKWSFMLATGEEFAKASAGVEECYQRLISRVAPILVDCAKAGVLGEVIETVGWAKQKNLGHDFENLRHNVTSMDFPKEEFSRLPRGEDGKLELETLLRLQGYREFLSKYMDRSRAMACLRFHVQFSEAV